MFRARDLRVPNFSEILTSLPKRVRNLRPYQKLFRNSRHFSFRNLHKPTGGRTRNDRCTRNDRLTVFCLAIVLRFCWHGDVGCIACAWPRLFLRCAALMCRHPKPSLQIGERRLRRRGWAGERQHGGLFEAANSVSSSSQPRQPLCWPGAASPQDARPD